MDLWEYTRGKLIATYFLLYELDRLSVRLIWHKDVFQNIFIFPIDFVIGKFNVFDFAFCFDINDELRAFTDWETQSSPLSVSIWVFLKLSKVYKELAKPLFWDTDACVNDADFDIDVPLLAPCDRDIFDAKTLIGMVL